MFRVPTYAEIEIDGQTLNYRSAGKSAVWRLMIEANLPNARGIVIPRSSVIVTRPTDVYLASQDMLELVEGK